MAISQTQPPSFLRHTDRTLPSSSSTCGGLADATCPPPAPASPFSQHIHRPSPRSAPTSPHNKLGFTSVSDRSPHRLTPHPLIAAPTRPAASALPSSRRQLTFAVLLRHQNGQLRRPQQQQQQHPQSAPPHLAAAQRNNATPLRPPATRTRPQPPRPAERLL